MGTATFTTNNTTEERTRSYVDRGRAVLLIAEPPFAAAFETAVEQANGRLLRRIGWSEVRATLPLLAGRHVIVAEASGIAAPMLDATLPLIAAHLSAHDVAAVIAFDGTQIDVVARYLLGAAADLLCDPDPQQRGASLVAATHPPPPLLRDRLRDAVQSEREPYQPNIRETDEERLRRLTDGMARISRFAADVMRMSGIPADLGDRRASYDGEPAVGAAVRPQEVRRLIQCRQLRSKFFGQFGGEALFEDPAWDMLLDLFAAELEGAQVSVSSLCIAAGVAPTTALRWIAKMTELGLFIRHPDPTDRRRAFMTLSPRASEAMRAYMLALRKIETMG